MNDLPHPHNKHLEAAEGWLGLGNWREAEAELEQIDPALRTHPLVLEMRFKISSEGGQWALAAAAARELRKLMPENPWGHFHLAFCLHELKETREAYATLAPVVAQFPEEWLMRYNLACYACQLGNLPEALQWLEQAAALAEKKEVRRLALADPDLKPLWPKLKKL